MTTSSVPAVKDALIEMIAARPGTAGVNVTHVWPGDTQEQEAIYLGRVTGTNEWATMRAGRKTRNEEYRVELFIWVFDQTEWGPASESRAFELMAEVEDAVAEDPTLGTGIPTLRALTSSYESTSGPADPSGWGTRLRVDIEVRNRLT